MTIAGVALAVSIVSVVLSLCSLGWNINVFVMSGPKVKVTLTMGTYGPGPEGIGKITQTLPADGWASVKAWREDDGQHFFIHATNIGRAAIWVDEVGLCCGSNSTHLNVVLGPGEGDVGFGPGLPFKLDAGQTVRWALPLDRASILMAIGPAADTQCVHGQVALGNGTKLTTKEGARVGLLREALSRNAEQD